MNHTQILLLKNMPIFHSVSDDGLEVILAGAATVEKDAGEYFFRQGEEALYMYVIESGSALVTKAWSDREAQLAQLGVGDCFGEMALISASGRSASVRAETACRAIEISSLNLQALKDHDVEQFIAVHQNISRELCRRLLLADDKRMAATEPRVTTSDEPQLPWPPLM